jgi:hypothetical protein
VTLRRVNDGRWRRAEVLEVQEQALALGQGLTANALEGHRARRVAQAYATDVGLIVLLDALAEGMAGYRLAVHADQAEPPRLLLQERPHALQQLAAAMRRRDHRLPRLRDRPQVGPLQRVVANHLTRLVYGHNRD